MRIDLDINDELMKRATALGGTSDQKKLIERALTLFISTREHDRQHAAHSHMVWEDTDDDAPIV